MYPYFPNYNEYQRPYQQPLQQQMSQQIQQNTDERIWVQGEDSAKAYLVAPNSFVRLWDSQDSVFYEKRTDASGRPIIETYRYEKVESVPQRSNAYEEKIMSLEKRILALEKKGRKKDATDEPNADDTSI